MEDGQKLTVKAETVTSCLHIILTMIPIIGKEQQHQFLSQPIFIQKNEETTEKCKKRFFSLFFDRQM